MRQRWVRVPSVLGTVLAMGLVTVLATLTGAVVGGSPAHAAQAGGHTHGDSGRLQRSCRTYTYDYRVRTPYDDWTLETTILDRDGEAVHADAFIGKPGRPGDRRIGRDVEYRLCRYATRPGRFRIRAKLTWYDHSDDGTLLGMLDRSPAEGHVVRLPVERFRLHR